MEYSRSRSISEENDMILPASELEAGMSFKGIDGYMFEVEHDLECSVFTGSFNISLGKYTVVTFHDSDGEENYMLLNPDVEVEVQS
jgi:hypothetical protein